MNISRSKSLFSVLITAISSLILSCGNSYDGPTFTINGTVKGADGKTLYLSNVGVDGVTMLDSAKLDSDGNFSFEQPQPECYDFYFLTLKGKRPITVAIDSTECVTLECDAATFEKSYTVKGSEETVRIKELTELQEALEKQVNAMINSKSPAIVKTRNDIYGLIAEFKRNITTQYIATAPNKAMYHLILKHKHIMKKPSIRINNRFAGDGNPIE
jgi:hypothetical protein